MKSFDTKGLLFYVWLGVMSIPLAVECSNTPESLPTKANTHTIKPIIAKGTRSKEVLRSSNTPKTYTHRHLYHNSKSSGVVLKNGEREIRTGLTSEEIVNQLSLDYQDLYDYYGGAEEIF